MKDALPLGTILVALRKESVDRNKVRIVGNDDIELSLSARRAWIEIAICRICYPTTRSLSARRAWIEINKATQEKETSKSRSPQGERG